MVSFVHLSVLNHSDFYVHLHFSHNYLSFKKCTSASLCFQNLLVKQHQCLVFTHLLTLGFLATFMCNPKSWAPQETLIRAKMHSFAQPWTFTWLIQHYSRLRKKVFVYLVLGRGVYISGWRTGGLEGQGHNSLHRTTGICKVMLEENGWLSLPLLSNGSISIKNNCL